MKKSKKLLSGLLSLMMIFSSAFIINAADTDTVEKTISLLDLSGHSSGEISELPYGMASINAKDIKDNYTGSRHIATVDGKKVLRQNFDVKASAFTTNNLSETGNGKIALAVNVPSTYLPYLEYISLDYNNATNSNLRFEFGIYNGTNYSKKTDVNNRLEGNVKYSPLNLYKVGEWGAVAWMDKNSAVKWKKEDLSTVKQLFLIVSTPESGCNGTEGYYLDIKDIAITVKGSRDELNAAEKAANANIERKISLFDLSGLSVGEVSSLPDGVNSWSSRDTYTGTREITEVGGRKVLRQNFDVATDSWSGGNLADTKGGKLALTVDVPSAYLPYLEYINLDYTTTASSRLKYEFGMTDGESYSKLYQTNDELAAAVSTVKHDPLNLYKIGGWNIDNWGSGDVKWTKEELLTVKQLFLIVSTPESGCNGTEGYYLDIKDIAITVKGSRDELNAAEAAAAEAWKTLYDFEGYADGTNELGGVSASGAVSKVIEGSEYSASGTKALNYVNTAVKEYEDKSLEIPLNSYVKRATGVSLWIYNTGKSEKFKVYLNDGSNDIAQKQFTVPTGAYIKLRVDFNDMNELNDKYNTWDTPNKKSLTEEQIKSLTRIILQPTKNNTDPHPGFYIDDVKYEQDAEHTYSKTVPLDNVTFGTDTTAAVEDDKIVFTPGETAVTALAKINVPEKFFAGASAVTFNFTNTIASEVKVGALVNGTNDEGKSGFYWKWGENKDAFKISANAENAASTLRFDGTQKIFESNDGWWIENWCGFATNPPSGSEKATITSLDLRIFDFAGTEGTLTLNSITVAYAGNSVKAAAKIENGSVSIERANVFAGDRAGFTLLPEDGYIYKSGSLKIAGADGSEIKVERDGFRKTNIGYYYTFDMPDADITISAEFIPAKTVIISAEANETDKSLKFDLTAATKGGNKVVIEGTEREIISVGALVTTDQALTDYGFEWADLTRELGASSHRIAAVIDDINIGNEGSGLVYDKAHEFIRYNVIIKNLSEESRNADFLVRAYIEYKNENGEKAIAYFDDTTYCYNEMLYGGYYNEAASFSKGISYSGPFEQKVSALSKSNKIFLQETFDDIAAQGFDSVRLPVDFSSNTSDTAPYAIDETLLSYLDTVVKNTLRAGMTIIVDFHQACRLGDTSLYTDPDTVSPKYLAIWQQLAEHYKEYPDRVVFEAINEPGVNTTTFTSAKLMELQEKVLEIVRKTSETRKLMVATGSNNSVRAIENITQNLINDKNVIAAVHCYWPMSFTHQGANWIKNDDGTLKYPGGVKYTDEAKAEVESAIKICKDFSEKNNMAVWLGEFGVYQGGGAAAEDVQAYLSDFTKLCGESKISWCYWEYNVGFSAYDESTGWRGNVLAGLGLGQ